MSEFRKRLITEKINYNPYQTEYICSNGKDYIVIDYQPNTKTCVEIEYRLSDKYTQGTLIDGGEYRKNSRFVIVTQPGNIWFRFGNSTIARGLMVNSTYPRIYIMLDILNNKYVVKDIDADEVVATYTIEEEGGAPINTFTAGKDLSIFYREENLNIGKGHKLYYIKIYENNKLLYDLLPYDNGNKNGLYNTLTNKLYTSVLGGNFLTSITQ